MLMLGRRLDNDVTMHDVLAELVEPRSELTNAGLDRRRGLHVSKGNLQGQSHGAPSD